MFLSNVIGETKTCVNCGETLTLDHFPVYRDYDDREVIRPSCKLCTADKRKEYRKNGDPTKCANAETELFNKFLY